MSLLTFLNSQVFATEVVYNFVIVAICLYISIKAHSLYELSSHKGIKYFRNAFVFFAFGFILRFVLNWLGGSYGIEFPWIMTAIEALFHYTMSMSGFYLVLSLIWKRLTGVVEKEYTLHFLGVAIAILNFIGSTDNFMFFTMLGILAYAIIISYGNYVEDAGRHYFLRLYYIVMVLAFVGWGANFLAQFVIPFYPPFKWYVYLITWTVFGSFFYGVAKIR
jgi:hypothetical protein